MKRCHFLLVFAVNFNVSMKRHMLIVSPFCSLLFQLHQAKHVRPQARRHLLEQAPFQCLRSPSPVNVKRFFLIFFFFRHDLT